MYKTGSSDTEVKSASHVRLENIKGSFDLKFTVNCKNEFDVEAKGSVENGIVYMVNRVRGDVEIEISNDGQFSKFLGLSPSGKADAYYKGRVSQDVIEFGLYFYKPGTDQLYCLGKDTSKLS